MNLHSRGRAPESGRHAREGRLLALFDARHEATTAVDVALRRHGAETISIEREWIDGMQAIRAAWPVVAQGSMDEAWLRHVVYSVAPGERNVVRANLGQTQRVAIFVSRRDHCIADLMQRSWSGALPWEIALIVSNHEDCRQLAELYGVPFHCFDLTQRSKESAEADQLALVESYHVDLIVWARYTQIPELESMTLTRAVHLHIADRVLPVNDRVVFFEDRATRCEVIHERQAAHGVVPDKVAARHWLTVEWPLSELQECCPAPSRGRPRSPAFVGSSP